MGPKKDWVTGPKLDRDLNYSFIMQIIEMVRILNGTRKSIPDH